MLKINDKAPLFQSSDQNGNPSALTDMLGQNKKIILYFYPKDNTPGCTAQACSLRDGYAQLVREGFVVIGVSPDSAESHQKFIEKKSLPFTLLSDADHTVAKAYGTWGLKKFMGREYMGILRNTFIINPEGIIEKIFDKVDTKDHFNQILKSYKQQ